MRARLIVFPVKGRNWCFSRSIDPLVSESGSGNTPSTLKDLWKKISFNSNSNPNVNSSSNSNANPFAANAELVVDFVSNKMNKAWIGLEKAPEGTFKNKLHGVGLKLLARVKPSEIFLKTISNEVSHVEVTYPSRSLSVSFNCTAAFLLCFENAILFNMWSQTKLRETI